MKTSEMKRKKDENSVIWCECGFPVFDEKKMKRALLQLLPKRKKARK